MTKNLGKIKIIFHWLGKTSTLGLQTFHSFYNGWKYITLLEGVQHFQPQELQKSPKWQKYSQDIQNGEKYPQNLQNTFETFKITKIRYIFLKWPKYVKKPLNEKNILKTYKMTKIPKNPKMTKIPLKHVKCHWKLENYHNALETSTS